MNKHPSRENTSAADSGNAEKFEQEYAAMKVKCADALQQLENMQKKYAELHRFIDRTNTAIAQAGKAMAQHSDESLTLQRSVGTVLSSLAKEQETLDARAIELTAREANLVRRERDCEQDFARQRADLERELEEKRNRTHQAFMEEQRQAREAGEATRANLLKQDREEVEALRKDLEEREIRLKVLQEDLIRREDELSVWREHRKQMEDEACEKGRQESERELEDREAEIEQLREERNGYSSENRELRRVLRELGSSPEELQVILEEKNQRIQDLEEDFEQHSRRVAENIEARKEMEEKYARLLEQMREQKVLEAEQTLLRAEQARLQIDRDSLVSQLEMRSAEVERLNAALKRLQSNQAQLAVRDERIRELEIPFKAEFTPPPKRDIRSDDVLALVSDEQVWLGTIHTKCEEHGYKFPRAILHAFHTALKTATYSPLTVLAGVSGTGKSKLPELYSLFGGMVFKNEPVQPNWDSQEALLGYFNTLDNRFEARPVLRLLAQSQQKYATGDNAYPGLADAMVMILLDEMNLAHIELYFAEFLSKFEERRGQTWGKALTLPVKLGSGMEDYSLQLGRNVLWAGTMNQDETTKSLSDKVLDRGTVIYFPRPKTIVRNALRPLPDTKDTPLLHMKRWASWQAFPKDENQGTLQSEMPDVMKPYEDCINEVNECLGQAGRALGHRVWQSIESYMNLYPDVRFARADKNDESEKSALKAAFEDQLVQKVMPKLRGIETRGSGKKCLDKIKDLLRDYPMAEDFDRACNSDYGQFIWQSADYISTRERDYRGVPDAARLAMPDTDGSMPEEQDGIQINTATATPEPQNGAQNDTAAPTPEPQSSAESGSPFEFIKKFGLYKEKS